MRKKDDKLQKEIAGRLLLLRLRWFDTASEMAREVHMSPQSWYNYETGRRGLDHDIAHAVVKLTGVDFNWLYCGRLDKLKPTIVRRLRGDAVDAEVKPSRRKQRTVPKASEINVEKGR